VRTHRVDRSRHPSKLIVSTRLRSLLVGPRLRPVDRRRYCLARTPAVEAAKDRFERTGSRFVGWEVPSLIGLAGSLGSPGLWLISASATSRCWVVALGLSGLSHSLNGVISQRRRSRWSGPVFVTLAVLGVVHGSPGSSTPSWISWISWDDIWIAAFVTWSFWFVHDRHRPSRRYRPSPLTRSSARSPEI
jgi:hypothetical protein